MSDSIPRPDKNAPTEEWVAWQKAKGQKYGDPDTDVAWSDKHIVHVYLWLLDDERSPFYRAPTMLFGVAGMPSVMKSYLVKNMRKGMPTFLRFQWRMAVTRRLKAIQSGEITVRVDRRNKLGWVRKYTVLPSADPQPLPIPPYLKATINLTANGPRVMLGQSTVLKPPRGDKSRLLNPFGV